LDTRSSKKQYYFTQLSRLV